MVGAITRDRASSIRFIAISQKNFVFLRMADPASTGAPFRRGILIGVRLWEVGRKAHRMTWDLLGTEVVPIVGFALYKVAVWNTWLHGMVE
jgi:hypothetical protein